jgi:hypothetical protein
MAICGARSKHRIDERRQAGPAHGDEGAEQQERAEDWQEPPLFVVAGEAPQFANQRLPGGLRVAVEFTVIVRMLKHYTSHGPTHF